MTELEEVSNRIDAWCKTRGLEWTADITGATLCAWSAKLTIILTPDAGPGRCLVAQAAGGDDAAELLDRAWADMHAWLTELGMIEQGAVR